MGWLRLTSHIMRKDKNQISSCGIVLLNMIQKGVKFEGKLFDAIAGLCFLVKMPLSSYDSLC